MSTQKMSFWQIWNMSFGFFGIQFGWGLQMANMSAIYQFLGADASKIPILWIAAPLTGLLVQPIVGYYSDRTWNRFGRRRPYFLIGAIFASLALIAMPNSSTLWMAAGLLWILDASINISMEPFRAFVGDLLPPEQRKIGFSMQSLLIGLGAVIALAMPWLLTNVFKITDIESSNEIPFVVHISFYVGAVVIIIAVFYTVFMTKEHPPRDIVAFKRKIENSKGLKNALSEIVSGIGKMPKAMKQLAVTQFFTWFGLFCMWIYFVPAISTKLFNPDPSSEEYIRGTEWGGLCFSAYSAVAFFTSFALIYISRKHSAKSIHIVCLAIGGVSMASIPFVNSSYILLIPMVGIGIAWASILAMPYAILSNSIPSEKMGFFMGVFNFFIVLPQIVASAGLGSLMKTVMNNNQMNALLLGGIAILAASVSMLRVASEEEN